MYHNTMYLMRNSSLIFRMKLCHFFWLEFRKDLVQLMIFPPTCWNIGEDELRKDSAQGRNLSHWCLASLD